MATTSFILGSVAYSLFDDGIANILGLETLRHGTNPFNYLNIRIRGGDPSHGGKSSGSTKNIRNYDTKNYFYVFKDSRCKITKDASMEPLWIRVFKFIFNINGVAKRIFPRYHAIVSGYNFTAQYFDQTNSSQFVKILSIFLCCASGAISLLVSPTLRFRFSKVETKRFQEDPDYKGDVAYRTTQLIEPWRIGSLGSLLTGINFGWFSRAKANPLKILTGIVQLTSMVAITSLCINPLYPNLVLPAAAGALLA